MCLAANSQPTFPLAKGWSDVQLIKRDDCGNVVTSLGRPVGFHYHLETQTGDLYGIQERKEYPDSPGTLSAKACIIFLMTPLYTTGMISVALVRLCFKVSSLVWKGVSELAHNLWTKGLLPAVVNATLTIGVEMPIEAVTEMWRIIRSPLYGIGIMAASFLAIPCPLEGRKWLGKLETDWHEGLSYAQDIRYKGSRLLPIGRLIAEIFAGKVYLLGYCMAKRGNLRDRVAGQPRFEPLDSYHPLVPKKPARNNGFFTQLLNRK